MGEQELARLLLVQACEESDPEGRFLPASTRERATRAARSEGSDAAAGTAPAAFLAERARRLAEPLEQEHPALALARRLATARVPWLPVLGAALLLGIGVDSLGGARRINLLAFPLLGLLIWNLGVYAVQGLAALRRSESGRGLGARLARIAASLAGRLRGRGEGSEARRFAARSLSRFGELAAERLGPLLQARARALLHAAAAAFAAGIVGSMYVGGFAFEYRASWESTFLDAAQVSRLLGTILGPAASVLGISLPDAVGTSALHAPASGDAAPWIHLWGLTALAVVGLPRALLAAAAGARARTLAGSLAPDEQSPYVLRLLAGQRGGGQRVEVLRYSTDLTPRSSEGLRDLAFELFGNRADIAFADDLAYGDDPPVPSEGLSARVVVFNLAQSPEQEVHGAFLEACKAQLGSLHAARLLVLLDPDAYRRHAPAERVDERLRSWSRMLRAVDLEAALVPAGTDGTGDALGEARQALWPAATERAPQTAGTSGTAGAA